uniref:Uncharacterized protein n=1 Tax=Ralstonia solanacearum TaxID=305 RepID=A0A0S4WAU0_RALSL|nr:protein of unknown function [Ralstonia solanacearum]
MAVLFGGPPLARLTVGSLIGGKKGAAWGFAM